MAHVVTQPCCNDASCVSVCPVDCIHPTPAERAFVRTEMLYIDPVACIDCGACVDECPVDAIVPPEDLTPETIPFVELSAEYYASRQPAAPTLVDASDVPPVAAGPGPLRVAIVGSGPSACYVASELEQVKGLDVEVTMFERLPVPGGLVRFGVAPDHAKTKQIAGTFQRTMSRKGCHVYLNVEVGKHLTLEELRQYHHAVVYATGSAGDRRLGVPGESLTGSWSAREFVAWYNGHPDYATMPVDLSGERAVVIGNGNVALDIARVLTSDVERLARTDIADHALRALENSRVREVVVVGRRDPRNASYSTSELIGLGSVGVEVRVTGDEGGGAGDALTGIRDKILQGHRARGGSGAGRVIELAFMRAPVEILGTSTVTGVRLARTVIDPESGRAHLSSTDDIDTVECGLVVSSIGFRGTAQESIPFDSDRGVLANVRGAVVDAETRESVAGVYVAGWLKRGSTGTIGTNRFCAAETVREIVADFAAGRLANPTGSQGELAELVLARQPRWVDMKGWKAIDAHERREGRAAGRPRRKVVDVAAMLDIAGVG